MVECMTDQLIHFLLNSDASNLDQLNFEEDIEGDENDFIADEEDFQAFGNDVH